MGPTLKILVCHGWASGNIGDILQTTVLLDTLLEQGFDVDFAAYPATPAENCREMLQKVRKFHADKAFIPNHFLNRFWSNFSRQMRKKERAKLFGRYDCIISAPGPFLAEYDKRCAPSFDDLRVAKDLGKIFILSSHSIGPLSSDKIKQLRLADLIIAREPHTHKYLAVNNIESISSSDYTFLTRVPEYQGGGGHAEDPHILLFLRYNCIDGLNPRISSETLIVGDRPFALRGKRLIVTTSDVGKDGEHCRRLALELRVNYSFPKTDRDLVTMIAGAEVIISDRYHPCVLGILLGKQVAIIENREPAKMGGLRNLYANMTVDEIKESAQRGLDAILGLLK